MSTGRILTGYRVDGSACFATVTLDPGTEVCRQCLGTGRLEFDAGYDGFERRETCQCDSCDGEGIVYSATEEREDAA